LLEATTVDETRNCFPVLEEKKLKNGTMKLVSIEGTPVLLINQTGQIFAIDNRCPHMGCRFSDGSLDGFFIVCPCHEWHFNLKTGKCEVEPAFRLRMYEVWVELGQIWVKIEE
jgi:nitrite reductase/ring-hydroxylating ferredoxin subunit